MKAVAGLADQSVAAKRLSAAANVPSCDAAGSTTPFQSDRSAST